MKYEQETYTVVISRDPKTGIAACEGWAISETRNVGGREETRWIDHRIDGPATIWRDPITGIIIEEEWYKGGRLHRDDGPAIIRRDPHTGEVKYTSWYFEGVLIPCNKRPKNQSLPRAAHSLKRGPSG
jgi:hypothetical protein